MLTENSSTVKEFAVIAVNQDTLTFLFTSNDSKTALTTSWVVSSVHSIIYFPISKGIPDRASAATLDFPGQSLTLKLESANSDVHQWAVMFSLAEMKTGQPFVIIVNHKGLCIVQGVTNLSVTTHIKAKNFSFPE